MIRPDPEAIEIAAAWLECNEGEGGESEACKHVATWLREYGRKTEERAMAREAGCSLKYLRKVVLPEMQRRTERA
jgi:hypothetical protein